MESGLHDCIYLTAHEFLLLAAAAGIESIDGIFRETPDSLEKEDVIRSVFSLCERGLMTPEEEMGEQFFRPAPAVKTMFEIIKNADETRVVGGLADGTADRLCYIGEEIVVAEISETDENALRLFVLPRNEFDSWLEEIRFTQEFTVSMRPEDPLEDSQDFFREEELESIDIETFAAMEGYGDDFD